MLSRDCRHRLGSTVGGAASSPRNPYGSRLQTVRPASEVIRAWSRVPRNPRAASSKSCVSENGSAASVAACCLTTEAEACFVISPLCCCVIVSPCFCTCSPDGAQRNPGSVASCAAVPDFVEFIIGRAFRATRWLHPGYEDEGLKTMRSLEEPITARYAA